MSNLIKGYAVKYDYDEKLKIDFNERAEELIKKFIVKHPRLDDSYTKDDASKDGFVAGLNAVRIDANQEDNNIYHEQLLASEESIEEDENDIKITQEAEAMAEEIIKKAEEEAERIIANSRERAQNEKKDIFKKAEEDGYNKGIKKSEKAINAMKEELENEKKQLMDEHERMLKELEPQAVSLIIALVHKLTGVLLESRKDIIFYLVQHALYGAEHSSTFIIRVSREDYGYIQSRKEELFECVKKGTDLEIVEDALLSRLQCLIDADSRVIDLSLDVQLENLIESLKMLAVSD